MRNEQQPCPHWFRPRERLPSADIPPTAAFLLLLRLRAAVPSSCASCLLLVPDLHGGYGVHAGRGSAVDVGGSGLGAAQPPGRTRCMDSRCMRPNQAHHHKAQSVPRTRHAPGSSKDAPSSPPCPPNPLARGPFSRAVQLAGAGPRTAASVCASTHRWLPIFHPSTSANHSAHAYAPSPPRHVPPPRPSPALLTCVVFDR